MKEEKQKKRVHSDLDSQLESLPEEKELRQREKAEHARKKSEAAKKAQAAKKAEEAKRAQEKQIEDLAWLTEAQNTGKSSSSKTQKKAGAWTGLSDVFFAKLTSKEKTPSRMTNKEFARVTYLFVTLFVVMIGYLVHFNVVKAKDVINSPYNVRQDLMAERVVRGDIVDQEGNVLAHTEVDGEGNERREYPYGRLFSHAIGYCDNGKTGVESIGNFNLLTSNAFILEKVANEFRGVKNPGDTVVTTLDANLQKVAYDALGKNRGAVFVMEASTGKILAMVSKPDYDPNEVATNWEAISGASDSILLNRVLQGQYTPGSTFKLVTALEYMREKSNYANYSYNCEGEISAGDVTIHCYNSTKHGTESLTDSVANSCNASFSNIGLSLNVSKWRATTRDLLFGRELPGDLPAKKSAFNLEKDSTKPTVMMTSIGQSTTTVSPYHMALITAAIANGGKLMSPYLIQEIDNHNGDLVKKYYPQEYGNLMTSSEASELKKMMKAVVDYGTGAALSGQSYTVAGKTGTAEVSMDKETVNSWFVGFSNVDNPELVISVVIENADTASITGVSVAKKVFNAYY